MKNARCATACLAFMILIALAEYRPVQRIDHWNPLSRVLRAALIAAEGK